MTDEHQLTEKSFLRIFSYFGNDDANKILQDIKCPGSNILRGLSADKTSPVVSEPCSTFKEFQNRFISKHPVSALPDTAIGLAFRGQASATWRLESSLFRLWTKLKMPDNCGTSMKVDRFISLSQDLAKEHLNFNRQNLRPDDGYLMFAIQEGVFAWQSCPADLEWYISEYPRYIKTSTSATRGTLWIVTLPVSERPAVMNYLAAMHITREKLFAGWDEIGRDIVSKYIGTIIKEPIPGYATGKAARIDGGRNSGCEG